MVKCVILAAGEGKRVHPLTYTRPKVMLPVANKPLIEWNLINAIKAGLKEFVFVVAYKSEMVRNYFGDGKRYNVKIEYVNQGEPQGTAHAIGVVERFVDDFIVLSGDTIFGVNDIKNIVKKNNSMGVFKLEDVNEYGLVETREDRVVKIYEKMTYPFTDVINAGVYHFDNKVFDFIRKTVKSTRGEFEITDTINMMAENSLVSCIMLKEWRDVVYPWHLLDVNMEVLKKLQNRIEGIVEENVTIKGKIVVGKNSVLMNGCYIEGPVVIGDNCKIGPNCYIRPFTSIGDGCHIGNACEVKNSIVFDGSNIPHQNYVGDSIIGSSCNFGAGSKVANLRFDKKNIVVILNGEKIDSKRRKLGVIMGDYVQTGINSMMNVGTILSDHVFIGPGAVLSGEVASFSRIL